TGARDGGRSRSRRPRAAKKRTRRRTFPVVLVCVVLVAGLAGGGYLGRTYLFPPDYEGEGSGGVRITVAEGASGSAVASELADEGVVAGPRAFLNALDADGGNLEPGTYRMNERMSGEAAVAALMDPSSRVKAHITFKEGLRSSEILTLISEETDIPMERLRAALENGEQLGLPGYAEQGAEGYLFPDTYDMPADAGAPALLKRMVDRYHQVAEDVSLKEKADELNLTPDEALSVAAVVQAESGSAEDMPKVARVVYNRLQDGMQLGMDSTCFYVLDEYGIALTSDQVEKCENSGSEYATYGRTGLPAGPIVSPGRDAIEAALEPAEGDWLYFVATDPENGVTEFAETYDEFAQLKQEFERNRSDA
ncbi:endolytic transglycosylase MltG, partial [Streptomonospora salina]|uniref:endolytic transglycosylase MltG n=1 Tax=Streptomonospora salina TaxID=104205 RepID=UPI0035E5D8CB